MPKVILITLKKPAQPQAPREPVGPWVFVDHRGTTWKGPGIPVDVTGNGVRLIGGAQSCGIRFNNESSL